MNFKVFLALFVGLLTVNVSVQSPTLKDDDSIAVVVDAFNGVLNYSAGLLNSANTLVDYVDKNQDAIRDRLVELSETINERFILLIDTLRDGATDDGKAIIDCIDAETEKSKAAFAKLSINIGNCVSGETPQVVTEFRAILKQLSDLQDDAQGQVNTLSSCSQDELVCLASFFSTISKTNDNIVEAVLTDVIEVTALLQKVIAEVQDCSGEFFTAFRSDVQVIFNEAVTCVTK